MKRRTLLAGLGASAAGSAILFGSGAFTQVEAERDLTIGVDEDSNALLALEAGTGVASVFADSGELVVDTRELSSNDEGFGVNSTVQIGRTETDFGSEVIAELGEAAFKLTNNFDTVPGDDDDNNELDVAVNLEDLDDTGSDIDFIVSEYEGGGSSGDNADENYSVSGGSQLTINNLGSGDELYFAIRIDTASTTNPDDIDGNVVFRAGPNLASEFPTDAAVAKNPVVNATQDTIHSGIQAAVNNASSGDLIQVDPSGGPYGDDGIDVDIDDITIESVAGSVTSPDDRPTIKTDASVDRRAVKVDATGVTLDGLDITFVDGSDSSNAEKTAVRSFPSSGTLDLTVRNCAIRDFATSDDDDNDGAVRATGVGIDTTINSSPTSGLTVENCVFDNIRCEGNIDNPSSAPDADSKAKGVGLTGEVDDARIVDNTFSNIGTVENPQPDTARTVSVKGDGAKGTEKPRGISLVEGDTGSTIHKNFEIVRNDFDGIEGTFGQPAIFIGGSSQGLGANHVVEANNFRHPVDNLSSGSALNLTRNYWDGGQTGTSTDPALVSPDSDEDGGVLIDRETNNEPDNYDVSLNQENPVSDAGSSLSL